MPYDPFRERVPIGNGLYTAIKRHFKGREKEALAYLWDLQKELTDVQQSVAAYTHLKALELVLDADEIIERQHRGLGG